MRIWTVIVLTAKFALISTEIKKEARKSKGSSPQKFGKQRKLSKKCSSKENYDY